MSHTPGPWRLELLEDRSIKHLCPVGPDDMSILTIVEHDGKPFAAIYKDADAHLIAAAPEVLCALRKLHEYCRKIDAAYRNGLDGTDPTYCEVSTAIQKATGAA